MKLKLPLIAVFVGAMSLTACGGSSGSVAAATAVTGPTTLVATDVAVGTGNTVATGSNVTITYVVYLYNASATDFKGTQVDSGTYAFTAGAPGTIAGVSAGIVGMKVGGHRILLIPAAQAYGSAGSGVIPPNSGLVFEMTLLSST